MRTISIAVLALVLAGLVAIAQEVPPPAAKSEQHAWLDQLLGEWTVTFEATMAPEAEPIRMEGTEKVRALGELWVIAEGTATMAGSPMNSVMTLGYDLVQKAYVGNWVDTMQTHMWVYRGTLDENKKVLTLETKGPSFDDPAKTSEYRDAIEIVAPDHKRLTSSVKNAEGAWNTFMRAEYKRIAKASPGTK